MYILLCFLFQKRALEEHPENLLLSPSVTRLYSMRKLEDWKELTEEEGTEQEDPRTKRMGQFIQRLQSGMKVVPEQHERQELLHIHSRPALSNTAGIKHLKRGWSELRCKCNKTYACVHAKSLQLCPTLWDPWIVAHQAPLSMGFSRQEYWSGLPGNKTHTES